MIKHFFGDTHRSIRRERKFFLVYLAMLILSLHWATVLYVHSTFLEQFVESKAVGTLFIIGSALSVFGFLFISQVLRILGNYKITVGLTILEFFVLVGLGFGDSMRVVVPLFILHQAIVPLILFNLDVFVESITQKEDTTGAQRGIMLTAMNFATALAPLFSGFLISSQTNDFSIVYFASALFLLPFLYVIGKYFKTFKDASYSDVRIFDALHHSFKDKNLRYVFCAHFLLQLFFAWMVIYVPLYLATEIGLSWDAIGIILFIGLMAYVFLEYPVGKIADLFIGEKEMMMVGFFILAFSTAWISFVSTSALIPWIVTMFLTRVGASLVEATTETYFFKHTQGKDADIISFFRITRPLAIVVGALLGSFTLLYVSFGYMFVVLGVLMVFGILSSALLKDTR